MAKNAADYHKDAIRYNEAFLRLARELQEELSDPTVKKWCESLGNLHQYHLERHENALKRVEEGTAKPAKARAPRPNKKRPTRRGPKRKWRKNGNQNGQAQNSTGEKTVEQEQREMAARMVADEAVGETA